MTSAATSMVLHDILTRPGDAESSGGRETLSFHSSESSGGREILSFHSSESSGIDIVNSGTVYWTTTNNTTGLFCGWSPEELRQALEADPDIGPIRAWMETSNERPPWVTVSSSSPATKTHWTQWKRLYLKDTILVRRFYCLDDTQIYPQVVLPRIFRPDVMKQMHDGKICGHFGVERTVARLQTRYFCRPENAWSWRIKSPETPLVSL
ncbi:hypothetical protein NHX12_015868 [Muraenolepis orangiensis]|uniref:Gypsy retrotransposon integrase-like protein 1 n=1 Tax=Muraenolepis orangiensis TaxID=630683 RepID=A0A9Q0D7W6_9TELE|nr:hypothetical protein NHX12_015868 [Muraenolepis orangiensis]